MTTFTIFARLPLGLRLKIWTYAQPNSRIVQVTNPVEEGFLDFYKYCCNDVTRDCYCLDHHDALLLACKGIRCEHSKIYSQLPTAQKPDKSCKQSRTFFDLKKDIILLGNHEGGHFDVFSTIYLIHLPNTLD